LFLKECGHVQYGYSILDPNARHKVPDGTSAFAVMIKVPRVGAVKTRLVPPLTPEEAAALSACFLRDVTANIAQLATEAGIHGFAAYTPVGEESAFDGILPPGFQLLAQRGANLGERLLHATEDFLVAGYQAVCLINADSPTLPTRALHQALDILREPGDRVVLGEAADGGYYLIGLKRPHRRLFQEISWSTKTVLSQTLERAAEIGLESRLLPVWYDVDDVGSIRRLCAELFSEESSAEGRDGRGYSAPHTRQYLSELMRDGAGPRLGFSLSTPEQAV
jgi:rSAM/selenodomain-associated transferase 1